jgi:hypothetical protein
MAATLPKMPYEVKLVDAWSDWEPGKGQTGKGRFYQINPQRVFPGENKYMDDTNRNIQSLVREPHKLTSKICSYSGFTKLYCVFQFDLTETDRANDAQEIKNRTMKFRRNFISINSDDDRLLRGKAQDLLVEDVEEKKKYMKEQNMQTVKTFLKETIGPNKRGLYAPPGIYGEKGGLLYRSAAKAAVAAAAATTLKQGGKRKRRVKNKNKNKTRRRL